MNEFQFPDPPMPNNSQRTPDEPPAPVPPYQPPPAYPNPSGPVPPQYQQFQPPTYPQPSAPFSPQYQPPPAYPNPTAPMPPNYSQPYVSLPPSHQVPPGYGYQAPPMQTSPVFPAPAMPEPPKRNRGGVFAVVAGLLVVVLLVGAFGVVLAIRNGGGTGDAQAIIDGAAQAPLHDVTFNLKENLNAALGQGATSGPVNIQLNGHGKMTLKPLAMDFVLDTSSLSGLTGSASAGSTEIILIGTDLYIKIGDISGNGKPWVKTSVSSLTGSSGLTSGFNTTNPFDYHSLHNAKIIGTDTLDGKQATHVRATLSVQDSGLSPSEQATVTAVYKQVGITQSDITEDLWIFKDNSFPAKVLIHAGFTYKNSNGGTSLSGTLSLDETMTFTAWNSGVTISPPPADQVSDGTDLLPTPPAGS